MKILITGTAGFIGYYLAKRLLRDGNTIVGIDNINDYYDVNLKYARLAEAGIYAPEEINHSGGKNRKYKPIQFHQFIQSITEPEYRFIRMNLEDKTELNELFEKEKFEIVINLAAQAGVRYSIENPDAYIQSNIVGFMNLLEACRNYPVKHLIYASSSSVYGANSKIPFSEHDKVDNPVSLYAATKKSNELIAHTYSHLYQLPTTGLRFFTVYGPWGRPDMAPMLFASAITEEKPIKVFNNGEMKRDFTYIDDIIEGVVRLIDKSTETRDKKTPYDIFNIGNGSPVKLLQFIETMENALGKKAEKMMMPMQDGDVYQTWANAKKLYEYTNFIPENNLENGIKHFSQWYFNFYQN